MLLSGMCGGEFGLGCMGDRCEWKGGGCLSTFKCGVFEGGGVFK